MDREGIAVNTEQRLAGVQAQPNTPQELRSMHREFWNEVRIQEFWRGDAFKMAGTSNLLSYNLARMLIQFLGRDWGEFVRFAAGAKRHDGGAEAALSELSIDLGGYVCALLEKEEAPAWRPNPAAWAAN